MLAIFPAFISVHLLCKSCVMLLGKKTSCINKQDYFPSKRAFKKGALSALNGAKLFLPTPGPCRIILIPKVRELLKKEISEILYSKTLHSPLNSVFWLKEVLQDGKHCPCCISFQDTFVFKSSQPASPIELTATGTQVGQSLWLVPQDLKQRWRIKLL